MPDRIVMTGATGFVGRALAARLGQPLRELHFGSPDWRAQLMAATFEDAIVFHLAARVHEMQGANEADYLADNRDKTLELAKAAAAGGARRLVFLSTIKVNGEETHERPFTRTDIPAPHDAYARSKLAAEEALARAAAEHGLEYAIVRSPLVYGARVRGNLLTLLRWADTPAPLPFAAIRNRRSFVHVDDLARLLEDCARRPQAGGKVHVAAHRQTVSTARLLALLRAALGRPRRLFPVPAPVLEAGATLAGQGERMRRLTRSLEVDASLAERELDWVAQVSVEAAVEDMVSAYRAEGGE